MFGKLLRWLKIPVAEVPEEVAVCEFDCSKTQCLLGDWMQCERRLEARDSRHRNNNPGQETRTS